MRLILHTAAYWLMLTVRDAIPKAHALASAEFTTIRLRLLKLGARVIEMASRVRLAFAAACPDATLFRHIAAALMPAGPINHGAVAPRAHPENLQRQHQRPRPSGETDATKIAPPTHCENASVHPLLPS